MAELYTLIACPRHGALKGVTYMTTVKCISIGTPPEELSPLHAAYAKKVITKPEYIIMARKIIVF